MAEERRREPRKLVAVGHRMPELEAEVGFGRQQAAAGFHRPPEVGAMETAADTH